MDQMTRVMRLIAFVALVLGLGFTFAPTNVDVAPLALSEQPSDSTMPSSVRVPADSIT